MHQGGKTDRFLREHDVVLKPVLHGISLIASSEVKLVRSLLGGIPL